MAAGGSAKDVAERAQATSERYEQRATNARHRAARYAAGHEGEVAVADALAALTATGWHPLHDRTSPAGGNIDHLLVGPGGVYVIDAKNWSYPLRIVGDRVFTGQWSRDRELDRVLEVVGMVKAALAPTPDVFVRGVVAHTGADHSRPASVVRDVTLIGTGCLHDALSVAKARYSQAQVESLLRELTVAFPPMSDGGGTGQTASAPEAELTPPELFERATRIYYLREWRGGGAHRVYLVDQFGVEGGWKECITGAVTVTTAGSDAVLVDAVLRSATNTGLTLTREQLPKVPVPLLGSKMLGRAGGIYTNVLVGQEWKQYGKHRLYGTFVVKDTGTFVLGHVDMRDGSLHPKIDGPIGKDLSDARSYLQLLRDRKPQREPAGGGN